MVAAKRKNEMIEFIEDAVMNYLEYTHDAERKARWPDFVPEMVLYEPIDNLVDPILDQCYERFGDACEESFKELFHEALDELARRGEIVIVSSVQTSVTVTDVVYMADIFLEKLKKIITTLIDKSQEQYNMRKEEAVKHVAKLLWPEWQQKIIEFAICEILER